MARSKQTVRRSTGGKPSGFLRPLERKGKCKIKDIINAFKYDIYRITLKDTKLGTDGVIALADKFVALKQASKQPLRNPQRVEITGGEVTDEGMTAIIANFSACTGFRELYLDHNDITLTNGFHSIMTSLNSSPLSTLSLCGNRHISPASISAFFDNLTAANLDELALPNCLTSDTVMSITAYLASPRSRMLRDLRLSDDERSDGETVAVEAGVLRRLLDGIEDRNFRLTGLVLPACRPSASPLTEAQSELVAELDRLTAFLGRNELHPPVESDNGFSAAEAEKNERVQRAALRYIAHARVLFNAKAVVHSRSSPRSHFRFTDLPREIVYHIVRETSRDTAALSSAQYRRLQKEAEGREGLQEMVKAFQMVGSEWEDRPWRPWLAWAGCNRWEVEG